jgi:beta-lactam-binding protein with PASTA domain/predicted Ser/Thr protein kinase
VTAQLEPDVLVDGRYRLVARIGSGGMADVWCAEDQELGRRIALKVLHPRFAADPQFVERFRREASHAAGLQHPNVVAVFDRGEWHDTPYIAMEHIEGPTLKEIVRDRGALPSALAADVVVQILRAARYAHKHGIVHRDLKPHNVILDEEGRVKVTDFGIARAGASEMTETGAIMGTAHYLSPEQAQGLPVDGRSDLYSIGVILYELLTGRVPFDAESPVSIAVRHVSEIPVPPAEINPAVPPALDAVTMRALAKAPEDRFQDADAFIAALQAARDTPMEAPAYAPAGPAVVVEEEDRGGRWWLWLIALLALAAIAFGVYTLLAPKQATVPDVVGQRSSVAAQTLQNRGFEVDIQRVVNAQVPKDRVATQNPGPGRQADEGSTVRLFVSDGPGSSTIPPVTGMPLAKAEKALKSAGFRVSTTQAYSSDVRSGQVISATPAEGSTAEKGSTVRLTVSRGAQPVAVPSVVGKTADEARGLIEGKGLKVSETDKETTSEADGTVLTQSPAGGSSVKPGSTVTLTVAKAPPQAQVPDVSGDTKDEARQALRDNKLHVTVVRDPVDTPDQDGLVVKQEPQAGTMVDRGTIVTIHLGEFTPPATPDTTPTATATPSPTATATP